MRAVKALQGTSTHDNLGSVARKMVSAAHWLTSIETNTLLRFEQLEPGNYLGTFKERLAFSCKRCVNDKILVLMRLI